MTNQFNFDDAVKAFQAGKNLMVKMVYSLHWSNNSVKRLFRSNLNSISPTNNNLIEKMALALKQLNLQLAALN